MKQVIFKSDNLKNFKFVYFSNQNVKWFKTFLELTLRREENNNPRRLYCKNFISKLL